MSQQSTDHPLFTAEDIHTLAQYFSILIEIDKRTRTHTMPGVQA